MCVKFINALQSHLWKGRHQIRKRKFHAKLKMPWKKFWFYCCYCCSWWLKVKVVELLTYFAFAAIVNTLKTERCSQILLPASMWNLDVTPTCLLTSAADLVLQKGSESCFSVVIVMQCCKDVHPPLVKQQLAFTHACESAIASSRSSTASGVIS